MPVPTPSWAVRNGLNAELLDADGKNPAAEITYDNGASGLAADDVQAAIDELAASAASPLTVKDEGSSLATAATSIDFVGAGVVASGTGAGKTVTVSGAPTGAAGGDLSGTYPNPSVVNDSHSHTGATLPAATGSLGPLLLASDHAIPITFDDILQASDGADLLYASTP